MSWEQESIWLNDQFQTGSGRYVESWIHRLRGTIDTAAIEAALTAIVTRHEPLRTALVLEDGRTVQVVCPPTQVPLDIRLVTADDLPEAVRVAISGPLPAERPPLLRATLLRIGERDAVLAIALHHAVIDGWSLRLLDEEFSELYQAFVENRAPDLAELPLSFGEYATARRQETAAADEAMEYWRRTLDGAPDESAFPLDRPRPQVLGDEGGLIEFTVGADLGAAVHRTCRELRTTPFVLLTAALTVLVSRLGGQDDIVLGTPVSRRDRWELEPLIACLTDVMPLRQHMRPGQSFRDLVAATSAVVRGAMAHRCVPFSRLVGERAGERTQSRFPLFQIVFTVDDAGAPGLRLPGVTTKRLYSHNGTAKFDVFLNLIPQDGGYRGRLEYAAEIFDPDTAGRLTERFLALLADAAHNPDRAVDDLAVMSQVERHLITDRLSHGPEPTGDRPLAHEATERTARLMPDVLALVDGERRLTYAALWAATESRARWLVACGLARKRIGIRLERSADAMIAILAVLRAGGACVPIDPALPLERTAFMIRDSGAAALLTGREVATAPGLVPPRVTTLFLEDAPDASSATLPSVTPDDLAYVVYTSGSTGQPKGVAMPHRSLAALLAWQCQASDAADGTRTLQFAPLGFDVAFQEIFSSWGSGGTLVLVPDAIRGDPHRVLDLIEQHSAERLFLPYVALQQLAAYAVAVGRRAYSLREVITAGEELYVTPAIREFFAGCPQARLENQYGPSETHVVTAHPLTGAPTTWPDRPPIGRPVPGSKVYILDERLRPRPIGAVGEICVAGDGVALGYLSDEATHTRRFTPDIFAPSRSGLLYRTGDLGRFLADGTIQFLGRIDGQVKIRGYRVEPGEAEAALKAIPGVTEAVVLVEGTSAEERHLAAYFTGTAEPDQVHKALRDRLPHYLLPPNPVRVTSLPRTASGKTDRAAVHRLHSSVTRASRPVTSWERVPSDGLEHELAAVWTDILRTDRISPDDDFFSRGGNSLLAVRLAVRLRTELDLNLRPADIFAAPTISALASLIRSTGATPQATGLASRAVLAAELTAASEIVPATAHPRHILLTGATGFLGAFLLRDLLERTHATVHCLVRADDTAAAHKRLRRTLERYQLWCGRYAARIQPLVGDLGLPRLGLDQLTFDHLARSIDAIFHSGAAVNLTYTYDQLKAVNVDGTAELLRLAASHRTVPMHHVSTVGVYPPDGPLGGHISPAHSLGNGALLRHGYAQTKWVAEALVAKARERSLPVTVFRPTRISGETTSGLCQTSDFLWLLVKGCLQAGIAPCDYPSDFDLVPVDFVSAAISVLSTDPSTAGRTYHLSSERHLSFADIVARLRALGYRLDDTPLESWHQQVEQDPGNAAFPLLGLLPPTGSTPSGKIRTSSPVFDSKTTRRALRASGVTCAVIDDALFARYVGSFVRDGFLPPPQSADGQSQ
ncbi:amino acid adenylation domain-containing protein [Streptomyces sp. NPDC088812]|uniref:non-ribosomal peptide synthetase n=1 Tax=Streptomyces sp. NPDC088812 TaxID=3365905 RepID=UPI003828E071